MLTPYLYVPLIAWAVAQVIKMLIEILKGNTDWRYLYASGGMPSAHAAVVCSLAGYAFYHQGLSSPLFGVTAILAGIVMYDSFGVRRSAGEQARTLNKLIAEMSHNGNLRKPDDYSRLREILGHQPLEVIVGALLGGLIATILSLDQLTPITGWLSAVPDSSQIMIIYIIGLVIAITPIIIKRIYSKKIKANKKASYIMKYLIIGSIILGIVLVFAGFVAKESGLLYGQRWVAISILVAWVIFILIVIWRWLNIKKTTRFSEESINISKQGWLKKAGKK